MVKRESYAEIPPRVEYSLTEEGISLWKAIIPLLNWTVQRGTMNGRKGHSRNMQIINRTKNANNKETKSINQLNRQLQEIKKQTINQ